jgi:transcriptional regulator with XRE-family HTH domain
MAVTSRQCRAARILLQWSPAELAAAANIEIGALEELEADGDSSDWEVLEKVAAALERAGIVFIEDGGSSPSGGPGLRFRLPLIRDEGLRPEQLTTENDD